MWKQGANVKDRQEHCRHGSRVMDLLIESDLCVSARIFEQEDIYRWVLTAQCRHQPVKNQPKIYE
jgi:hypothetical protein